MSEQNAMQNPQEPSKAADTPAARPPWGWIIGFGLGLPLGAEVCRNLGLPDVGATTGEELGKWLGFGVGAAVGGITGAVIGKLVRKDYPIFRWSTNWWDVGSTNWLILAALMSLTTMSCAALGAVIAGNRGAWIALAISSLVFMGIGWLTKRYGRSR